MIDNLNFLLMAWGAKDTSVPSVEFPKYVGIAPIKILAVNPTEKEKCAIFGTEPTGKEPEYVTEVDYNGKKIRRARICFVIKTVKEVCGVDLTTTVNFFVSNKKFMSKNGEKLMVMDNYGRDCWVTKEQFANKTVPEFRVGRFGKDYHAAFEGERELVGFMRAYLNVDDPEVYDNNTGSFVERTDLTSAEGTLENIANYFNGDFSELKGLLTIFPDNTFKALFGVRHTDDNKDYQDVFTKLFVKNNVTHARTEKLFQKALDDMLAYSPGHTDYEICPIKEAPKPQPADISSPKTTAQPASAVDDLPFGDDNNPWSNL